MRTMFFVPALEVIVERLQMSNDVAGATFMAAGSSAPELFTSLVATFLIVNEGGVGTIIGSAIFNILVIVGATGYVACRDRCLPIWWYPLTRDCFFYSLSILELYLVLFDEEVRWYEGVIMIITYISYCLYMKINPMIIERFGIVCPESAQEKTQDAENENQDVSSWQDPVQEVKVGAGLDQEESPEITPEVVRPLDDSDRGLVGVNADVVQMVKLSVLPNAVPCPSAIGPGDIALVKSYSKQSLGEKERNGSYPRWSMRESHDSKSPAPIAVLPDAHVKTETITSAPKDEDGPDGTTAVADAAEEAGWRRYCKDPLEVILGFIMPEPEKNHWLLFSLSIFFIGAATYLMVDATNRMGVILKIPPLVMGLIFLAAGTSIPDAMGSIAVAKQGEGDMAVSNALGSNVFDILVGLGVPWTIKCGIRGKPVELDAEDLQWDILILAAILVLFIGSLVVNSWRLSRRIGLVFLSFYILFVVYNIFAVWVFKTKETDD